MIIIILSQKTKFSWYGGGVQEEYLLTNESYMAKNANHCARRRIWINGLF